MKGIFSAIALIAAVAAAAASDTPIRALVLDFEDRTGQIGDSLLGGSVSRDALAEKGAFLVGKAFANRPEFNLVDRRDFLRQLERSVPMDEGRPTPVRPSFLQAAQSLRADVVIRGSLLSVSPGKQLIHQGGYETELATFSVRVGLEALDARDGSIIAAKDGVVRRQIRQTEAMATFLGEDDLLEMMEQALNQAVPAIERALTERAQAARSRPTARLSVRTSADPALVEVDGVLVGATPIEGLNLYQGDHVLAISRPGYQTVTKRILLERDTSIEVPMLRDQLTADELKELYEKMQLNLIRVEPGLILRQVIP
ncbi:MAG: PEGA domain-containing protein [Kiritimatiellae bacterium]|nr:PEGA domain-containing protein [Kiritimatiellia bacterium]MDW8457574.1 PEGA domain-containing protein [Verrucomicrobiota bacterium]